MPPVFADCKQIMYAMPTLKSNQSSQAVPSKRYSKNISPGMKEPQTPVHAAETKFAGRQWKHASLKLIKRSILPSLQAPEYTSQMSSCESEAQQLPLAKSENSANRASRALTMPLYLPSLRAQMYRRPSFTKHSYTRSMGDRMSNATGAYMHAT